MRRVAVGRLLLALAVLAAACTDDAGEPLVPAQAPASSLTVYSGRDEELLRPVVEQFEGETGIDVEIRAGDPDELVATIAGRAATPPADVYYGPSTAGLVELDQAGRLQALPPSALERVDPRFRAADGWWLGVTGRMRALAYHTGVVGGRDLPDSIFELTDDVWEGGRIGWAPTDASFRTFLSALRVVAGEEAARAWLAGVLANEPRAFPDDAAIVAAIAAGDLALGLVDHDAVAQLLRADPGAPVASHLLPEGDVGSLVLPTGVGVIEGAPHPEEARRFVEHLVSEPVQEYFAAEAFEIPLVPGIAPIGPLPPVESLTQPAIDPARLADQQAAADLLAQLGIV